MRIQFWYENDGAENPSFNFFTTVDIATSAEILI